MKSIQPSVSRKRNFSQQAQVSSVQKKGSAVRSSKKPKTISSTKLHKKINDSLKPSLVTPRPRGSTKCELETSQISKAVNAAFQAFNATSQKLDNDSLFKDDPTSVILLVSVIKTFNDQPHPIKVVLPHPFLTKESDVCLIVKDLEKGWKIDHEPTNQHYQELLNSKGVHNISEVMALRQLRIEYKPYEARSKLSKRFDALLVDRQVSKFVPRYLGKSFYQAGKLPISLDLGVEDLQSEVNKALATSIMSFSNNGNSSQLIVGLSNQTVEEITQNIQAVYNTLIKKLPGKFENVRSLSIRLGNNTWTVPIYISYAARVIVKLPERKTRSEPLIDDLSTLAPGWKIAVYPGGKVEKVKDINYTSTNLDTAGRMDTNGDGASDTEIEVDMQKKAGGKGVLKGKDKQKNQRTEVQSSNKKPNSKKRAADDSSDDEADVLEEQYMEELEMLEDLAETNLSTEHQESVDKSLKKIERKVIKKSK